MSLKPEEVRKKAYESELQTIELAVTAAVAAEIDARQKDEERTLSQLLEEANQKRIQKEAKLKQVEEETLTRLQKEIKRRTDLRYQEQLSRKKAEEEAKRKAEEEQKRADEERKRQEELRRQEEERKVQAELERKRAEEEARRKAEEDRKREEELRRQEEERKVQAELERKRSEEETRRKAEEEQKKQEDLRKKEEERKLQAEQERKRKEEEEARRKVEEEARQKAEAERKQRAEEQRQKDEAAKRQLEEERARIDQESRKRIEEELRRKQEEQRLLDEKERVRREEQKQRESILIQEARERERVEREQRIITLIVNARQFLEEGNLDNAKAEIAKALLNDPTNPTARELQSAIEQKLEATTASLGETENVRQEKDDATPRHETVPKVKSRVPVLLLIGVVAGALVVATVLFFQLQKKVFSPSPSFAALPWQSATGVPEDNILGSSLAEEVIKQFEWTDAVNVLGFNSAYGLKNGAEDPSRLATSLGYTYVLKGSIERSGDSYKFDVSLRDSMGSTTWEKSYVKSLSNLSSLPAQVYLDLMGALNINFPDKETPVESAVEPNAYFLYLRGKELIHRATRENYENAYQLFQQAVEQDRNFAIADIWKAMTVALSTEKGFPIRNSSAEEAMAVAQTAITRLPASPDGFIALGILKSLDEKYNTALQLFDSAEAKAPHNSTVFLERAKVLVKTGELKDALNALESAFKHSPRDPEILTLYGQTYQLSGNITDGMWYYETALYFVNDSTEYLAGSFSEAILLDPKMTLAHGDRIIASYRRNISADSKDYRSLYRLARLYQLLGQTQESLTILKLAENVLQEALRQNPQSAEAMSHLALVLTRLGKYPEGILFAQKALQKDSTDAELKYRAAQVYSMQMYSRKTSSIDENLKQLCITTLRDALKMSYRINELVNADFYNMYEHTNFTEIIRRPSGK